MTEIINLERKYLHSHTSQETAYIVDNYPWGFRLRTKIRYWIESKNVKGQRFCSQTINPKTNCWCTPKKSVYYAIVVMYLDENDHVKYCCCDYNHGEEKVDIFLETHRGNLTDFQKNQLKKIMAYEKVMKNVTFKVTPSTVGPVSLFSNDPQEVAKRELLIKEREEREKQQEENLHKINLAMNHEYKKINL